MKVSTSACTSAPAGTGCAAAAAASSGRRSTLTSLATSVSTHPYAARRYSKSIGREVPLREAVGSVAAESIEVYPPGVPLVLEGFRVSQDAVDYLLAARDEGGSIVARDTSLTTLRVL